jgi:hypothetical protein
MIPGKMDAVTCGQTINLRLPYGLLVSIGIEDGLNVQGGQNAMIKEKQRTPYRRLIWHNNHVP